MRCSKILKTELFSDKLNFSLIIYVSQYLIYDVNFIEMRIKIKYINNLYKYFYISFLISYL